MATNSSLRILVACECSQRVCRAFRKLGYTAFSCDIQPAYCPDGGEPKSEWHIQGDVMEQLDKGWDLLIAHPPCTYTGVVSNRYLYHPDDKSLPTSERRPHPNHPKRREKREAGVAFAKKLYNADIPFIALEHPRSVLTAALGHPQFWCHPYWFGSPWQKKTGWWIKGELPDLQPTNMVKPEMLKDKKGRPVNKWHRDTSNLPRLECARRRSCLSKGMAQAIAEQWGDAVLGRSPAPKPIPIVKTEESSLTVSTTTTRSGSTINITVIVHTGPGQ